MILVAPDKFKGTLSAVEAADIIASAFDPASVVKAPMADGGEGTAYVLCRGLQWERRDCYYVHPHTRTAVIDSSAVIGLQGVDLAHHDILRASSAPLGVKVREIIKGGCSRVVIGIGGTSTCDGGMGFLQGLGIDKLKQYRGAIVGLADVRVPLVTVDPDLPSALTFARQKGANDIDIDVLRRRLIDLYLRHPLQRSPIDGAGGGLGFAIASVIGAEWHDGASYVLDSYNIDWSSISLIITGEGCIDNQSSLGKVVGTLQQVAANRGIPILCIGGSVHPSLESSSVISTSRFYPNLPLTPHTAAIRLKAAISSLRGGALSPFL